MHSQVTPIALRTRRLELRTLTPDDACEDWLGWARDPQVMAPLNLPVREMSLNQLRSYISSFDNANRCLIGLFEKRRKTLLGFFMVDVDRTHRVATLNVLIGDRAWWGKGIVNEARAALLDHFFEHWKMEKAAGGPLARNFPAVLNYKAQGWRHEGTLRDHRLSVLDGKRLDQFQFGLLRSEWRKARAKGR